MFADAQLARRIELAEARLTVDFAEAVRLGTPPRDVFTMEVAGGVAVHAGLNSPMNKVIGMGMDGAPDERTWADVEREFALRSTPVRVEICTRAVPDAYVSLSRRGYVLQGFEDVLGRSLASDHAAAAARHDPAADITIREIAPAERAEWLDAVIEGFLHPDGSTDAATESYARDALEQVFANASRVPDLRCFSAFVDGVIAGGASLRCDGTVAQLTGASTLPAFRRRGIQTALLNRRLEAARERGGEVAVMTTEPGSRSQHNGLRRGFSLLYSRAVLVGPPPGDRP